jgi:hypothetical protein
MRSNGFQITGNELQAMVNERILGAKTAIPATTRCLTRAEVLSCVHVYAGPQDPPVASIPFTSWPIGGGVNQTGADPYLTCSYEYINPIKANGTIVFEMNQVGSPYLNCDLFAQVNGAPLRLDPGSNLDGMFFGGPQISANMASAINIGNLISIQANFGLDNAETPGNFGWNGNGYGVLEVYRNSVLISNQFTAYRTASYSANATQLTSSIIVESGVSYYVKAYPVEDNRVRATVKYATSFCSVCNDETGTQNVIGNATTFCASTSFTSSGFASLAAGNYVLAYGGNALNVSTNGTTTATMYGGGCTACLSTTATWTYVYQNCLSCVTRNIYQDTNTCSATYGQYKINDGAAQVGAPTNTGACDTAQNWTDNGTVISLDCVNYTVYKNTNPCSTNYNFYRYTNDALSATVTQESDPSTAASSLHKNWVFQYYNCFGCSTTRSVERDMNPCSDTYLGYTVNRINIGTVAPTNTGECSTAAIWTYQYKNCSACVNRDIYKDTNACSATFGQYKINLDGAAQVAQPTNTGACNTAATWTDNSTVLCIDCTTVTVYKNTNPCSSNHNFYRYTNPTLSATVTQESDPSGSACVFSPNWVFQHYNCLNCVTRNVERDMNPCSSTYLGYTVNRINVGSQAPANTGICGDCCGQSTTQVWTATGEVRCNSCVSQIEQKQTNVCAAGYDTLRWVNSGSNCSTAANYSIADGTYWTCDGEGNTTANTIYRNSTTCFTGNQWSLLGTTYATKPTENTEPSVAQNWQPTPDVNGYCSGGDYYQPQTQINPCAVNYGGTRDYLLEANSSACNEMYVLYNCADGSTGYSTVYTAGTFVFNQRVTADGVTYRILNTGGANLAGSIAITSAGAFGCPTATNTCIQYTTSNAGYVQYTTCLEQSTEEYFYSGATFCAISVSSSNVYSSAAECTSLA